MNPTQEANRDLLTIVRGIGLDPNNIPVGGVHIEGDILTIKEFDLCEEGRRALVGGEYRKRTRTYRLHPAEPIEEPA